MAKNMPVGVKILAILAYIGAVLSVIGGILLLLGSAFIAPLLANIPGATLLTALGATAAIVGGIAAIAIGVLYFFIGKGLWNGRNWARIVTLIFSVIGVITSIVPLNIVGLVVGAVVIWYLGFNKQAKNYFR